MSDENDELDYFRCLPTSFVISNMLTVALPPNTVFSLSSALMLRLFFGSCRSFFLMYCQSRLVTSVRGIGLLPITSASWGLGCIGFMNAAFAFRAVFFAVLAIKSPRARVHAASLAGPFAPRRSRLNTSSRRRAIVSHAYCAHYNQRMAAGRRTGYASLP